MSADLKLNRICRGAVLALAGSALLVADAAVSAGCDVRNVSESRLAWQVVSSVPCELPVDYPVKATRAVLTVTDTAGKKKTIDVPAGADSVSWSPFDGVAPGEDAVYELTLDYYDGSSTKVLSSSTARLAVLKGAFGDAVDVATSASSPAFVVSPRRPVFVVDPQWSYDTVAATAVTGSVAQAETTLKKVFPSEGGVFGVSLPWHGGSEYVAKADFAGTGVSWSRTLRILQRGAILFIR